MRFSFSEGAVDAERFIVSLKDLIQEGHRKVFLIVDNLRLHRANSVREWVAENADELSYLPPYEPEFNPDEYVNDTLRADCKDSDRFLRNRVPAWSELLPCWVGYARISAMSKFSTLNKFSIGLPG